MAYLFDRCFSREIRVVPVSASCASLPTVVSTRFLSTKIVILASSAAKSWSEGVVIPEDKAPDTQAESPR